MEEGKVILLGSVMICVLLAGCAMGNAGPTQTPTPNPTLVAISRMLTETRAAPTATPTPTITPTRVVTPSPTVEVILPGSRKLPAPGEDRFEVNDIALTILAAQQVKSLGRLRAAKGSAYLDLEVLLENGSSELFTYNPLDFRLVGAGGVLVQPAVDALNPALLSGDLRPGEWVRGHLAFAVAEETTTGLVRYRPAQNDAWPGETWLDLGGMGNTAPVIPARQGWPGADLPKAEEWQEASGIALTIEKVEVSSRLPLRKAEKGQRFVSLSVRIENLARERMPYNPLYFRVKDQQGYEYLAVVGSPETSLQAGTLGRGRMVRNVVVFEVPEAELILVVSYQPTVLVEEYELMRVVVNLPEKTK